MNVLVVTTATNVEGALDELISEHDTVKVVVPAVRQGVLDWLASDEGAFAEAEEEAERAAEQLPGEAVEAAPGEADVELAIEDALATFDADEIVVALRPDEQAGTVETMAARDVPSRRTVHGIPVRTVVVPD